jgi:PST family polysaccharide transporter
MTPLPPELTRRTIRGMLWMGGAQGMQAVLQLVVVVVLARLLSPADFGIVGAALVVVGISKVIYQVGLGPALVQRPVLEPRHLWTAFSASVVFGCALGAAVWLTAPAVAGFYKIAHVEPVLRALAWLFPIVSVRLVSEAQLSRDLQFRPLAKIQVATYAVGHGLVGVGLALAGAGVWALVAAVLADALCNAIVLLALRPPPRPRLPDWRAFKELMTFGGGHTLGRLGRFLAHQSDNIVVGRWLGAEALGLYSRAYLLMATPASLFANVLDRVLFPVMAKVQHDPARLAAAYMRSIALIALAVLPTSVVVFVLAPEVIELLFGPQWMGMIVPWRVLALGMLFRTSYMMSDSIARATGAVYRRAWRQLLYALLVVLAAWIGQHWGIGGVAICVLVALGANFLSMAYLSLRLAGASWQQFWDAHVPALRLAAITALVAAVAAAWLRRWQLPAGVTVAVTMALTLAFAGAAMSRFPVGFLGRDGLWMLNALRGLVPRRLLPNL